MLCRRFMSTVSNRQQFNQIQPPRKLYEKLERLGFGSLRPTKRYAWKNKKTKIAPTTITTSNNHRYSLYEPKDSEYKVSYGFYTRISDQLSSQTERQRKSHFLQLYQRTMYIVSVAVIFRRCQNTRFVST